MTSQDLALPKAPGDLFTGFYGLSRLICFILREVSQKDGRSQRNLPGHLQAEVVSRSPRGLNQHSYSGTKSPNLLTRPRLSPSMYYRRNRYCAIGQNSNTNAARFQGWYKDHSRSIYYYRVLWLVKTSCIPDQFVQLTPLTINKPEDIICNIPT